MSKPLAGQTILVTRPAHQSESLTTMLEDLGAKSYSFPVIAIAPPVDFQPLDDALRNIDGFDWVVLTSANGVESVRSRLAELKMDKEKFCERKIAVIGPATRAEITKSFRDPDLMPSEYVSEQIADSLGDVSRLKFLFPFADRARKDLANILRDRGAIVTEVVAYRIISTESETGLPDEIPNFITFTSSSSVCGLRDVLQSRGKEHWMRESRLACIGPITAATVKELGFEVGLVAKDYTIPGLVSALVEDCRQ